MICHPRQLEEVEYAEAATAVSGLTHVEQRQLGVWGLVTMGATMVGSLVGGLVIGLLVDHSLDTSPLFALVGLALGIVGAAVSLSLRVRRYLKS